jgi:ferredoxin-thioredoxin reductase catalytic chain
MSGYKPDEQELDEFIVRLQRDAESGGYLLNPDESFTRGLATGLLVNQERYSYPSCPCRLATGDKEQDLDIICPCDYRDPDLSEYGACYCALYVNKDIANGREELRPVPERRLPAEQRKATRTDGEGFISGKLSEKVWRCKVCGYLCARSEPPEICPICKAGKERFERFM